MSHDKRQQELRRIDDWLERTDRSPYGGGSGLRWQRIILTDVDPDLDKD